MIENPATGERVVFLETAADTGGEALVYELLFRPRGFVTREHVHPRQDERHEVLSGTLGVVVAGRERILDPGDAVVIPRGTPHRLFAADGGPVHARFELRPALRAEVLIESFVALARDGKVNRFGYPNPLRLAVLAREHGGEGHLTRPPLAVQRAAVAVLAPLGRLLGYGPSYGVTDATSRAPRPR